MKALSIFAGVLLALFTLPALAYYDCEHNGQWTRDGDGEMFYLVEKPKTVGEDMTCQKLERMRICESGEWSREFPKCRVMRLDGQCDDSWIDQLPDNAFTFTHCED